jgi:Immunity protein 26
MNLVILKKTRQLPQVGDIFAVLPPDGLFLFGRVIDTSAEVGPIKDCVLIYLYSVRSQDKSVAPELTREQLLFSPIMTNRLPWSRGYFERIENRPLTPLDRLPQHCFKDSRGWYFDEHSNRLPGPIEPVGIRGLHSFRTIDDEISKALGIPLSPDE